MMKKRQMKKTSHMKKRQKLLIRSVYFLINKVSLAEEIQELCNNSEKKSDNKVPVFEGNSQEFTVKEEKTGIFS